MTLKNSLNYFYNLIDNQGIIQFTEQSEKDYSLGYAIEDQARALILAIKLQDKTNINHFLSILFNARSEKGVWMLWDDKGCFKTKQDNFEEASAEVLWALGEYASYQPAILKNRQFKQLVNHLTTGLKKSTYTRVLAYSLLGISNLKDQKNTYLFADKLVEFYQNNVTENWSWFEQKLYYGNALMPWALIRAYKLVKKPLYLEIALKSFEFLMQNLVIKDVPVVVGNIGWWEKEKKLSLYDQQPIDVTYIILACLEIYELTKDENYLQKAACFYSWFLGNNLQKTLMIRDDGACCDGLSKNGPNLNSGAESHICYLLATSEIKKYFKKTAHLSKQTKTYPHFEQINI